MVIVVGMLLTCMVRIGAPGEYGSFLKNVPTKVIFVITEKNEALVEYDFKKCPGIKYLGDYHNDPPREIVGIADLLSVNYMNCKERK